MLVPCQKTVFIIDSMAFRRSGIESFLKPWAKDENVELISLQPEDAHARLIESSCDMLIYNVGGAHPSAFEILAEIQVLHTLRPAAALVILSDDTSQASIVAAMNSGARSYLDSSMAPGLALQALSFVLHGGTYFPPAAILAGQTASDTTASDTSAAALPHLDLPQGKPQGQPHAGPPQQGQVSIAAHKGSILQQQASLFDEQPACVEPSDSFAAIQKARAHLNNSEPHLTEREKAILFCLCRGDSNKIIARTCNIAESTVKIHLKSILHKIHVKNRTQAAIWAIQNGLRTASDPSEILSSPDLFISEDSS